MANQGQFGYQRNQQDAMPLEALALTSGHPAVANGIGIFPSLFNSGPLGAGAIAEAISVNPALVYIAQSGAVGVDIGASIVSGLPAKNGMALLEKSVIHLV